MARIADDLGQGCGVRVCSGRKVISRSWAGCLGFDSARGLFLFDAAGVNY